MNQFPTKTTLSSVLTIIISTLSILYISSSCTTSSGSENMQPPPPSLPVLTLGYMPATTYREYPAMLEGKVNVEIRPQVAGYLEHIYADEGAFVKQGQPLFRINDQPYREQQANADATLLAAKATMEKAQLEIDRLTPLVKNGVVSDIQLKTAKAEFETARANVAQAKAMTGNAAINVGYTVVKAPVSGYLGRIPHKIGSLVGRGEEEPLTVLSKVSEIYAYFSMSEIDFLQFKAETPGETLEEKLNNVPPVEVVLADDSVYPEKGRVETVEGQFDKTTGAISFRATFPNKNGLLRSGNTGRVRIPRKHSQALLVPQESTFEMQDKVMVFAVTDSNKVVSRPIRIKDQNSSYYFIENGVSAGDKIVFNGIARLRDGALIEPQPLSLDSLLKMKPL